MVKELPLKVVKDSQTEVKSDERLIKVGDKEYYYDDGVFYKALPNGNYVVVPAPVDARVARIPEDSYKLNMQGKPYYYFLGTYYDLDLDQGNFVVVKPKPGIVVPLLPEGTSIEYLENKKFYVFNEVYYRTCILNSGIVFMVKKVL